MELETLTPRASAARTDQGSKSLPTEGRLERMNKGENYESKFWAILTKEHLVDLSQFHKGNFFDEVPLFSRESDIEFLFVYPIHEINSILLRFALKFLKAVVSYEEHR